MKRFFAVTFLLAVMISVPKAEAAIILGETEDFSSGVGNWLIGQGSFGDTGGSVGLTPGTGGTGGDFLQINLGYDEPPNPLDVIVSNVVDYAGDYSGFGGYVKLNFDFYASNSLPTTLALFIQGANGAQWTLDFTPQVSIGWTSLSTTFVESAGWTLYSGGGTFADALAAVQTTGLFLEGTTLDGGTQVFGIDNWVYAVPEPGTMAMLSAAFLSMAMTFRRNLADGISRLKTKT